MRPLNYSTRIIIASCLLIILPLPALAGQSLWLDAKTGPSTFGGSLQGSLSFSHGPHLLKVRYTWAGKLIHIGLTDRHLDDRAYEVGLLYGMVSRQNRVRLTAAAGVAYTNVRDYINVTSIGDEANVDVRRFSGVGIPAEIGFLYHFSPVVAFGSTMFANFNKQKTLAGLNIGLQFGVFDSGGQ